MAKKLGKDLQGFKDIADIIEPKKSNSNLKEREGYAIYSFLEQEQRRLAALDDLFSKKYINIKRYPQTEKLLLNEIYKKNMLREDLYDRLKQEDSPLNKHLEQIFDSAFK